MELEVIAPEGAPAPSDPFPAKADEASEGNLSDIINRAMDGAEAEDTETTPSEGRARDEKGRFKAKDQAAEAAAAGESPPAAPEAAKEATSVAAENADPKAAPAGETPAPAPISEGHFRGWSPDERARFNSLPKDAQDFVLARQKQLESHYNSKLSEAGNFRKTVEPLASVTQEHADYFAVLGAAPHEAIRNMVQVSRVLDMGTYAQKVQILQQLAHNYGLPFALQQPDDPFAPGGARYAEQYDQRVELANVKAQLDQIRQAKEEAEQAQYRSAVETFSSQTDAHGQPKYPFFEQVRWTMGQLMRSGKAETMEDAYAQATAPIQAEIKARAAAVRAEAEKAQREAAEKARRASPVRTSPVAPNGTVKPGNLNDLINGALDRAGIA